MPRPSVAPSLLLTLNTQELEHAASSQRHPKWSTMCLLRRYGFPVLNACYVPPSQPPASLRAAIHTLAAAVGTDRLMLRSDGGTETSRYYRGGNTFYLRELEGRAATLLAAGRAVVLLEPTNRFTNQLAALLRLDRPRGKHSTGDGEFTIEALGPGYDVADLTRGGISPQVKVDITDIDWVHYEEPWIYDMRVTRDLDAVSELSRQQKRLQRIASDVLTDIGEFTSDSHNGAVGAENWLREHGYLDLFSSRDPTMSVIRRAKDWFSDAFLLAQVQPNRDWQCLAIAVSDLGAGRIVFWDLVNGARKWGIAESTSRTWLDVKAFPFK